MWWQCFLPQTFDHYCEPGPWCTTATQGRKCPLSVGLSSLVLIVFLRRVQVEPLRCVPLVLTAEMIKVILQCAPPERRFLMRLGKCSRSFRRLQEDWPNSPNILRQQLEASQFSTCEGIFRNTLRCFWLRLNAWFGLPREADVMSWHTLQHAIFIASSCFDHSMSGVNVK